MASPVSGLIYSVLQIAEASAFIPYTQLGCIVWRLVQGL